MARKKEGRNRSSGSISVGGDAIESNFVTGDHTEISVDRSGQNEAILALNEIQSILRMLSGPQALKAQTEANLAVEKAAEKPPNKQAVGSALQHALDAAKEATKTADELAAVSQKLAPYLKIAAGWLGVGWHHLIAILS
jgi:hypothetical protein